MPLSPTRRQFTVMVDLKGQHSAHRARRETSHDSVGSASSLLNDLYARELAKTAELLSRTHGASQTSAPWICDASVYDCSQAADEGVLLVGDAASFIEPLSSAGVKKALTSAWRAAVVTNTCLSKPEMAPAALDLYTRREREIYAGCRRRSAQFFSDAAATYDSAFWSARGDSGDPSHEDGAPTDADLVTDPGVRAAFDALRRAPAVRLRPAQSLRVQKAATIEGREVVMRDALVLSSVDAPVRFAAGVDLPALVGLVRECGGEMSSLIAAYRSRVAAIPVEGLLTGVSLLVAHRALVNEGSAS